jgi:hypothetical protein
MDPLDELSIPTPADDSPVPPPSGYGHIPRADIGVQPVQPSAARTQARRDVFWSNVVREILMALAAAAASSSGRLDPGPAAASASTSPVDELFDGRMGLITTLGQRIPIADIVPVFACTMTGCKSAQTRSSDVQCTVYRITTPTGESYTLPISQIIGVHSLTEALIEQLEEATAEYDEDTGDRIPFGFGAYTSLAQSEDAGQDKPTDDPI